ncbi:tyrosine-type recombinase/integrase [Halopseudomonas aestusnigri]|uniref:tyrosine-type recombinase/integrase n=1 Tax=Halopseudomonas aestusnigri TaxID=857252 RepID=UPI002553DE56|nr:tyrosine-type recombinase/integrase [Halopseudomonas aestusnigri]MDL2199271.1 tyrosine-type recombinase/integrase [Halopseudomonas aestusnigri]
MTATVSAKKLVPLLEGFELQYDPKYEKFYPTLLKQLLPVTQLLQQLDSSPTIQSYFDEVCQRFIDANNYSVKGRNMLIARMGKLKKVVSDNDPKRRMAELSPQDIARVKRALPRALAKQKRSKSQGENIQTYYQLFNRVMAEAFNDHFISTQLKLSNPRTKKADNTKPFSTDEICSLLQGWPYQTHTDEQAQALKFDAQSFRFWLLPLGLFTGARLNELCQLRAHDVRPDGHGIHVISINDDGYNKSLKNEQSRREIPICNALTDMGFLEFVQERRDQAGSTALLFAELSFSSEHLYSRVASRFFCGNATGTGYIGAHCERATEGSLNFKSCRRSFAQRLQASGVTDSLISHLLGHRSSAHEVTQRHYLDTPLSASLKAALEQGLQYGVPLSHLKWANYKPLVAAQRGRKKRGRQPKAA